MPEYSLDFYENIKSLIPVRYQSITEGPKKINDTFFGSVKYSHLYKELSFKKMPTFDGLNLINTISENILLEIFSSWKNNLIPVLGTKGQSEKLPKDVNWARESKPREFKYFLPIILFTSGTSGKPKPYVISLESVFFHYKAIKDILQLSQDTVYGTNLSPNHMAGLMPYFRVFFSGGKLVKTDLKNTTKASDVTNLSIVNSQLDQIKSKRHLFTKLRAVLLGGGMINLEKAKEVHFAGIPLYLTYGSSEMCSSITIRNIQEEPFEAKEIQDSFHLGSPIKGTKFVSTKPTLKIQGDQCFEGYLSNTGILKSNTIFNSNDIGEIKDGKLYLKGRADNIFISGGKNVSTKTLETILSSCPFIKEFHLNIVKDSKWGQRYQLLYRTDLKEHDNESSIFKYVKNNLSNELSPKTLININNANFKGIKPSLGEISFLGQEVPTVFIHGLFGDPSDWNFISKNIPNAYSLDLSMPNSIETFDDGIDHVLEKIKSLTNSRKVNLVGYSMGGRISYHLALRYPEKINNLFIFSSNLIGIQNPVERKRRYEEDQKLLKNINSTKDAQRFLEKWYKNELFTGFNETDDYKQKIANFDDEKLVKNQSLLKIFSVGVQPFIENPKNPCKQTVYFFGEKDVKYKSLSLNYSPTIDKFQFKNCGHVCHIENKNLTQQYLKLKI